MFSVLYEIRNHEHTGATDAIQQPVTTASLVL